MGTRQLTLSTPSSADNGAWCPRMCSAHCNLQVTLDAPADIKLENILLTKDRVIKLADFGLAVDLCEERAVTRAGTLDYMVRVL